MACVIEVIAALALQLAIEEMDSIRIEGLRVGVSYIVMGFSFNVSKYFWLKRILIKSLRHSRTYIIERASDKHCGHFDFFGKVFRSIGYTRVESSQSFEVGGLGHGSYLHCGHASH